MEGLCLLLSLLLLQTAAGAADQANPGLFTLRLLNGRTNCKLKQGLLSSSACKTGTGVTIYKRDTGTNLQEWIVVPVEGGGNIEGVEVTLKAGGRSSCPSYAKYPASCNGGVTLAPLNPNSNLQRWVLTKQAAGSYHVRPAACSAKQLAFFGACKRTAAQLLANGTGVYEWQLTRLPAPQVKASVHAIAPAASLKAGQLGYITNGVDVVISSRKTSDWGTGYTGEVTIQNNQAYAIQNWRMTMTFNDTFTWMDGANIARNGNQVTLTPMSWTSVIAAKSVLTISFGGGSWLPYNFDFTQLLPNPSSSTPNPSPSPSQPSPSPSPSQPSPSPSPSQPSPSPSPSPKASPSPSPSPKASPSPSPSPKASPSPSPSPKASPSPSPSPSPKAPSPSPSPSPSPKASPSPSPKASLPPPSPAPTPSPSPVPSPTPQLPGLVTNGVNVTVRAVKLSDWGTGYDGAINIRNNQNVSILNWHLEFTFNDTFNWISDVDVARVGNKVIINPHDWVKTIPAGDVYQLRFGSNQWLPTNFNFTQILPLVDPEHDPSLTLRGTFGAKVFSPYVDVTSFPTFQLQPAIDATGQLFYTLAFITASQAAGVLPQPSWAGTIPLADQWYYDQIRSLRMQHGDVIVSFGGANGVELAQAITNVDDLVSSYQSVIDLYKLKWIDFDIEGAAVLDAASVDRRNLAIKRLQAVNPNLTVSYCLPVLPSGLTDGGVALLANAVLHGVRVDVVQLMAMDYGDGAAPNPLGKMGYYAKQAASITRTQVLAAGLPGSTKIGIIPMLGVNDIMSEVFTLDDACEVVAFAASTPWVRTTSFWSLNRDNYDPTMAGKTDPKSSGIQQQIYAFTKKYAAMSCVLPPSPSPSPSPAAAPSPSPKPLPSPSPAAPSPSPKASPSPSPTPAPAPSPSPLASPSPSTLPSPSPVISPSPSPAGPSPPKPLPSPSLLPSPLPAGPSCAAGDIACFCAGKAAAYFGDTATGCTGYYFCSGTGTGWYFSCPAGLQFRATITACDYPSNVNCAATVPTPPPPPPSPPAPPSPPPSPPAPPGSSIYSAYYQTWSEGWSSDGTKLALAKTPGYVTHVILSFMQPDCGSYPGGVSLSGTGLSFSSDAQVVKDAVTALKAKSPNTKVMVAVGGATYHGWDSFNAKKIAEFVKSFNLDGVDIDYEETPTCTKDYTTGQVFACSTDSQYIRAVNDTRTELDMLAAQLGRTFLLSTAAFSVGAYGQGAFLKAKPGSDYTGMAINMLKIVGSKLDLINVMSYDAGGLNAPAGSPTGYEPKVAYDAYRSLYSGNIVMGVEVPPEAWGSYVLTTSDLQSLAQYIKSKGGNGMMLWSLQKSGTPSAKDVSVAICQSFALGNCSEAWPY